MKIATWNVNSMKVRLNQILDWIEKYQIDILALQETKIMDANFPFQALEDRNLQVAFSGQKTYNGMAIISRRPLQDIVTDIPGFEDPQRRILAATINGIRILNLYVPNGSSVDSEKYLYKLNWLQKITEYIHLEMTRYEHLVILGDFNIAPQDIDVHDPAAWEGDVLVSPAERLAFQKMLNLGLYDIYRQLHPTLQQFTWWDYRAASFRRNRGLRIDLILVTQSLLAKCQSCEIDSEPRKHLKPSDHTPLMCQLGLDLH